MDVIRKDATKRFQNGKFCVATEYPSKDQDLNGAVIVLSGRYPETGRVFNTLCKELGYVIKGSGKVVIEGNEVFLEEGDLVLIEPGEKFYWEGNLELFMPCAPAWTPEQHRTVD
jgi:mannose-6-phosphate isomerase-like protein (cupin superfamily)